MSKTPATAGVLLANVKSRVRQSPNMMVIIRLEMLPQFDFSPMPISCGLEVVHIFLNVLYLCHDLDMA